MIGYNMFRGSVKCTGYTLHSPVSPSLPLPCVTVFHHISTVFYNIKSKYEGRANYVYQTYPPSIKTIQEDVYRFWKDLMFLDTGISQSVQWLIERLDNRRSVFQFSAEGRIYFFSYASRGTRWRSWLRHCATSQKVAGSIRDGVIVMFHWHNPSGRIMALGST